MTDKLRSSAGETFAETLAAILIAALSVSMVAAAVVVAARINARTENQDTDFTVNSVTTVDDCPVTVKIDGKTAAEVADEGETAEAVIVTVRSTENGYYSFEYKKNTETGTGTGTNG